MLRHRLMIVVPNNEVGLYLISKPRKEDRIYTIQRFGDTNVFVCVSIVRVYETQDVSFYCGEKR